MRKSTIINFLRLKRREVEEGLAKGQASDMSAYKLAVGAYKAYVEIEEFIAKGDDEDE